MKKIFVLFCIVLIPHYISAQSAGQSGLSFLKIGSGARNIALGDNGATLANDATAIFYNPANLYDARSEIFVMHNKWIQDVAAEAIAVKFSLFGVPFGIGFNSTSVSDIEIRTLPGEPDGIFNAHYFAGTIGTALEIIPNLSAGAAMKYLYENIYSDESTGFGYDFGLSYKYSDNLSGSAVVRNIGSMSILRNEKTKLPTEIKFGAVYNLPVIQNLFASLVSVEYQKYTATNDIHINFGIETIYNSLAALRLGYMTAYQSKGFTAGLGFKWNIIDVDYAFTPFNYSLGSSHTVSLRAAL